MTPRVVADLFRDVIGRAARYTPSIIHKFVSHKRNSYSLSNAAKSQINYMYVIFNCRACKGWPSKVGFYFGLSVGTLETGVHLSQGIILHVAEKFHLLSWSDSKGFRRVLGGSKSLNHLPLKSVGNHALEIPDRVMLAFPKRKPALK